MTTPNDPVSQALPLVAGEFNKLLENLAARGVGIDMAAGIVMRCAALAIKINEGDEALQVSLDDISNMLLKDETQMSKPANDQKH